MTRSRRSTSGIADYSCQCRLEACQPSSRLHILSRSRNTWISVKMELHHSPHMGWSAAGREVSCLKSHFFMLCPGMWHPLSTIAEVRNTHIYCFFSSSSFLSCNCCIIYATTRKFSPQINPLIGTHVLGNDEVAGAGCPQHTSQFFILPTPSSCWKKQPLWLNGAA